MQNAAFAACGIDAVYVALHVVPAAVRDAVRGFAAGGVAGFNVTVPHKEAMLALVDDVRPRARACGAVNTVTRTAHGLVGDNTDGDGFLAALADARLRPRGATVLVIGAGGSARSVADALLRAGASELFVANRTPARAGALAAALARARPARERRAEPRAHPIAARRGRVHAGGLELLGDADVLSRCDLIVNCTTTGLARDDLPAIDFGATRRDVVCYDLMYGAAPSPFLVCARAARRRALDGRGMLLHQGALAFRLWTRCEPPIAAMRRALARALAIGARR